MTEKALEFLAKAPLYKSIRDLIAAKQNGRAREYIDGYAKTAEAEKSPFNVARFYAFAGENEKAFEWLEKAYQMRQADLISLKVDLSFDGLRDDLRYKDLLKRINLE